MCSYAWVCTKGVRGGCTGDHVYESAGMIKGHSGCRPVASSGECVTVCVMEPQRVVHTERATANVLHGANRATRAPSSLQGENESTRADPSPRWREASPPAPPRQTKRQSAARPGAGPGSYRVGWPAGPLGCSARTADPPPPRP